MKKPSNVKELCEFIWYLENKYDLLNLEIKGFKPWQSNRIEIYYKLGKMSGVFEKELKRGMSKYEKLLSIKEILLNSLFYNPFIGLKKVDYLVFSHPRSKLVNGKYIDIYSHYLIDDLLSSNKDFIEFETMFDGKHIREYKKYKRYLDFINLIREFSKFKRVKISNRVEQIIEEVQKEIRETILDSYNLKKDLVNSVKKNLTTYKVYKKILLATAPKEIYVIVGYGRSELIRVAKELNIKVIELQHGTFSKYHLGYSYPNKKDLDYFPNEFWVWNEYWKNLIEFPISKDSIRIYPFKYLQYEKRKYQDIKKIENQLVILGQGGLSDKIAKKILDNLNFFKKFKILFKLHPEEYGRVDLYQNLNLLKDKLNVDIVEDFDLYMLLAQSQYQGGVFSTALYEGIEFGCKTILFNLSGIEYMDKFINRYEVKLV